MAITISAKPSKQRKRLYAAPLHKRHKLFSAPLSPELKKSHNVNAVPVRAGDTVRIMRGDHKGFEGKVTRVDRKKYRVFIEGVTREKVDGTTIFVPLHPSKVIITGLNLDDKWRKKILERKGKGRKVETLKKPEEKIAKKEEEKPKRVRKPRRKETAKRKEGKGSKKRRPAKEEKTEEK